MTFQFGSLPNTTIGKTDGNVGAFYPATSFGGNTFGAGGFGAGTGFGNSNAFGANKFGGFGGNAYSTGGFGATGISKPFYPQDIGAEYLEASASYLAAKAVKETRDNGTLLLSYIKPSDATAISRSTLLMQQGLEFKSCFLQDEKLYKDSLYKLAVASRMRQSYNDAAKDITATEEPITYHSDTQPRMLSCQNYHGRVDVMQLLAVKPYFDLSDYIEIGPKYVSLKRRCPELSGVPVKVTLLDVFPHGRTVSDISDYKNRIKEHTERLGGVLINYSADTGIWEFELHELV